jgi:hypothetical protein
MALFPLLPRFGRSLGKTPTEVAGQVSDFMRPLRAIGAGVGGVAGYQMGDEETPDDERLLHAGAGTVLGGAAIPGMIRTALMAKDMPEAVVNGLYYSYLSSPDTIARANLGAAGGVMMHGLEQLLGGDTQNAAKTFGALKGSANVWWESLRGSPEEVRRLRHSILGSEAKTRLDIPDEAFRDVGLGKWFTAGDNAAVYAMKAGGLSPTEAMRYTLAGTPESRIGKDLIGLQSRWLRSDSPTARVIAATLAPFARVGVVGMEQGLKRIPGLGFSEALGGPGFKKMFDLQDPAASLARGRQTLGAGAMGAGAVGEDQVDPRLGLTLGTGFGPAYLPYTIGREFKRQLQRTPNIAAAAGGAVGEGLMEFSPLGFQPLGMIRRPLEELPRRLIPAAVGDVAEAVDPAYGRKMGRGELERLAQRGEVPEWMATPMVGQIMGRLPGVREHLPADYMPVDVFGRPRLPGPEVIPGAETSPLLRGFSRTLAPSRASVLPPAQNIQDPQQRMLYDLGIRPSAPSDRVDWPMIGGSIPMGAGAVAGVQAVRGQARERTAQILSQMAPWLMSLPPYERARMANYLSQYINQAQGQATNAASLAMALSGGGMPSP